MKVLKTNIIITFTFEGVHRWPDCNLDEVSYLKNPHRHLFHVEMKKEVTHSNRDIEFISFKKSVVEWVDDFWKGDLGRLSCEQIAAVLSKSFECEYVKVMEDGENGAEVFAKAN